MHESDGTHDLFYYYDADGSVGSISYDYTRYAFRKNLQGDVIAILDTNGDVVARYAYDAWGKVLSVTDKDGKAITDANHVANINPIRYRGYYYDTETGWYYLNSRYYDPSVKRFLNADGIIGANGNFTGMNLFAYCNNNPVIFSDPTGHYSDIDIYGSHIQPGTGGYQYGFRKEDYITNGVVTIQRDINVDWPNNGGPTPYYGPLTGPSSKSSSGLSPTSPVPDPVSDNEVYAGDVTSIASYGMTTIKTVTSLGISNCTVGGAIASASVLTVPMVGFSILADWNNPYLTNNQKWIMTGYDVAVGLIGIGITALLVSNPITIAPVITLGYGAASALGNYLMANSFKRGNGY